ncbi:MAG: sulfotransferase [Acidobacteriota bacterium]
MTIEKRIVVVGVPRSGTTLVQSLLAAHEQVASWTESHFFDRHFSDLRRMPRPLARLVGGSLLIHDPTPQVRAFLAENDENEDAALPFLGARWRPPLRLASLRPLLTHRVARALIELLDALAAQRQRPVWLEKTPAHLRHLDLIERVTRDAELHIVHVVRRGLDVVASLHRASAHWERHYGVDECVARWNRGLTLTLERLERARVSTDDGVDDRLVRDRLIQDHVVLYERLTADPEPEIARLVDALGLPDRPDLVARRTSASQRVVARDEQAWKGDVERAIRPSSTVDDVLTATERRRAEAGLRHELYEKVCGLLEAAEESDIGI